MVGVVVDYLSVIKSHSYVSESSTCFGVEEVPCGVDGGPVEVPVIVVFLAFGPASFQEVSNYDFLVEIGFPLQFSAV